MSVARKPDFTPAEVEDQLAAASWFDPDNPDKVSWERITAIAWLEEHGLCSRIASKPKRRKSTIAPLGAQGVPTLRYIREQHEKHAAERNVVRPVLIRASDVQAEEVEWLWEGRFPRGMVSMIAGNMGAGKSTFIGWLVSTLTRGGDFPDSAARPTPSSVIILQDEESLGSAQRPRLDAFGANVERVHFLSGVKRGDSSVELGFSLARDVDALDVACDQIKDVSLVLIDPLGSYLTGISGNNEAETREAIAPLFKFAERRKVAVICVAHLNKDADKPVQHRISGTFALPAKSRAVWYLSVDPANKNRRLLSLIKANLEGAAQTALSFGYRDRRLLWSPRPVNLLAREVDLLLRRQAIEDRVDSAGRRGPAPTSTAGAKRAILSALEDGPLKRAVLTTRILGEGFRESTYRKALKSLITEDGRVEEFDRDGYPWARVATSRPAPAVVAGDELADLHALHAWEDDGGAVGRLHEPLEALEGNRAPVEMAGKPVSHLS